MSSESRDMDDTEDRKLPRHVAVIMDGNNRWAEARGLKGSAGHRAGAEAARRLVYGCVDRGIQWLTLFAFSSENWLRPRQEVKGLMSLFLNVLQRREIRDLHASNVRLQFIGNRESFPDRLRQLMCEVESLTCDNTGTVVSVAADYGGRWDIAHACRKIADAVAEDRLVPEQVDIPLIQQHISLGQAPDPDLCIRTGGELRISNFLLWQMAYSELYFTPCYWPDFDETELRKALDAFRTRQRRYGACRTQQGGSEGNPISAGGGPGGRGVA